MNIFVKDFIIDIENFDEDLKKFIPWNLWIIDFIINYLYLN
jgi:hypothetical protein